MQIKSSEKSINKTHGGILLLPYFQISKITLTSENSDLLINILIHISLRKVVHFQGKKMQCLSLTLEAPKSRRQNLCMKKMLYHISKLYHTENSRTRGQTGMRQNH